MIVKVFFLLEYKLNIGIRRRIIYFFCGINTQYILLFKIFVIISVFPKSLRNALSKLLLKSIKICEVICPKLDIEKILFTC